MVLTVVDTGAMGSHYQVYYAVQLSRWNILMCTVVSGKRALKAAHLVSNSEDGLCLDKCCIAGDRNPVLMRTSYNVRWTNVCMITNNCSVLWLFYGKKIKLVRGDFLIEN